MDEKRKKEQRKDKHINAVSNNDVDEFDIAKEYNSEVPVESDGEDL